MVEKVNEVEKVRELKLLPKQGKFYRSRKKEVFYVASYGAGKSVALCVKLVSHAVIPGTLSLLTRKTRTSLMATTWRTLTRGDGDMPPILPPGSYTVNEAKSILKINGGGEIYFRGCDDEFSIRSLNLGFAAIDEAVEISEDEFQTITSRLRSTTDPCRQVVAATNPSSQNHWLYRHIQNNPAVDVITAQMQSNHHLPADYIADQMARYSGASYRRYILGEWATNEAAIYQEFQDIHKQNHDYTTWDKFIISLDIGYTDPTAILVTGIKENHLHVFEEVYSNKLTPSDIVSTTKGLIDKYGIEKIEAVVCDPSAKGAIVELQQQGITCKKTNNDIDGGIQRVKELLLKNQLSVSPNCTNLIREFDLYSYKNGTDKPEDANNHTLDSIRYCTNYYFDHLRMNNVVFFVPGAAQDDEDVDVNTRIHGGPKSKVK